MSCSGSSSSPSYSFTQPRSNCQCLPCSMTRQPTRLLEPKPSNLNLSSHIQVLQSQIHSGPFCLIRSLRVGSRQSRPSRHLSAERQQHRQRICPRLGVPRGSQQRSGQHEHGRAFTSGLCALREAEAGYACSGEISLYCFYYYYFSAASFFLSGIMS